MAVNYQLNCKQCSSLFRPKTTVQVFCSPRCSSKYYSKEEGLSKTKKLCKNCSKEFTPRVAIQIFCHRRCQAKYWKTIYPPSYLKFCSVTTGTINELRVAVDLFSKGYEVFRALSSDASCDLIALKKDKCNRIQVRTSTLSIVDDKALEEVQAWGYKQKKDEGRQDYYAVVCGDIIIYIPQIEESI